MTCTRMPIPAQLVVLAALVAAASALAHRAPPTALGGARAAPRPSALAAPLRRGGALARRAHVVLAEGEEEATKEDDGALYEPATPPKPTKPPISNAMRERLLKENRALGGDPDASSGNPILVVSIVVGILAIVVVGGGFAG